MKNNPIPESIYNYILLYRNSHGISPTMQEISDHCFVSKHTVFRYLDQLEARGFIWRDGNKHRSIQIIGTFRQ